MDHLPYISYPASIVHDALNISYIIHQTLGEKWLEEVQKNQFKETALKVDIEIEKWIIDLLQSQSFPIKILSEEHGELSIGEEQKYLWVLDGLDGSYVYKNERWKGSYGTMFAIFDSLNPHYNDYIASGIMEHSTGQLFLALKNQWSYRVHNHVMMPITTQKTEILDTIMKIYIDEYRDINRHVFTDKLQGYNTECTMASSSYYMKVAAGEAVFALECTRKWNLELAVAYALIKEANWIMIDINGDDIGDRDYLTFGQGPDEHIPIITAANIQLAKNLLQYIRD
jgi:fructose-1,6-bisphosphatase/inositol monophosphatase family enzyme